LFVDASGNVGLGTSSPSRKLTISGAGAFVATTAPAIRLDNTTTGRLALIDFDDSLNLNFFSSGPDTNEGNFRFFTGSSSGTERLRITGAGNVGIGTTSPQTSLHITSNKNSSTSYLNSEADILITSAGTKAASLKFENTGGSAESSIVYDSNGSLKFNARETERMRIDSSGRLLVGTSTSLSSTSLIQAYKSSGTLGCLLDSDSLSNGELVRFQAIGGAREVTIGVSKHSGIANPCAYIELQCEDAAYNYLWADNSDILRISTNSAHIGTTSGTVVGAQTSDERIKNILGPVNYGLDEIKQLDPVSYALKSDPEQVPHLGFIAQQVNPIIPESVFDTDDHIEGEPEDAPTKLGMEYVALIPVLVNAIKELSAEVDALKVQLQAS
jgi:hypothetical protein